MSKETVQEAERSLLQVLADEGRPLDPRELRVSAQNGSSWAAVDMAFWRLINRRELVLVGNQVAAASNAE